MAFHVWVTKSYMFPWLLFSILYVIISKNGVTVSVTFVGTSLGGRLYEAGLRQVFCSACSFMEPGAFCSCLSFPLSSIITLLCGLVRSLIVNVICLISNHIILYLLNFADKITTFPYCINRKAYNYPFRCTPNKIKAQSIPGFFYFYRSLLNKFLSISR